MVNKIHDWFIQNPLWTTFVVLPIFTAILYKIGNVVWSLTKVQPQRLGSWLLKSKLQSAERTLLMHQRLKTDIRYLIASGCFGLFRMLICLAAMIVDADLSFTLFQNRVFHRVFFNHLTTSSAQLLLILMVYYLGLSAAITFAHIYNAILSPTNMEMKLISRVRKLQFKVDLRETKSDE